jgi:hypothetical protein
MSTTPTFMSIQHNPLKNVHVFICIKMLKIINISNMLISVAELLKEVINLKTRLTGNVVSKASESSGYEVVRGNGVTCLHALLTLRVCELSDSFSGRLETKNMKKRTPGSC